MATAGGIFVTGHDPDYHSVGGGNPAGARHIIQQAVKYVTFDKSGPKLLLVTDLQNPGGDEVDSRLGMDACGFTYDVADAGSGTAGVLDLSTVDLNSYDCVVIASDYGGWLRQEELDILNARAAELLEYVNQGGGIVALSEAGNRGNGTGTTKDRFAYLPFVVAEEGKHQGESGFTLAPAGVAMGLDPTDINGNVSHSIFTKSGGMDPVDLDVGQEIMSLVKRGVPVGRPGFASLMWVDHLDLLSGDASLSTTVDATSSGVGGGLSGLVIESDTTGDVGDSGGNKVVWMALEVPPGYTVAGVRVGYELSDPRSFIDQIRLDQVQDPPSTALVLLDDATHLVDPGPVFVDSAHTSIDPAVGPLLLNLRVNFGSTDDQIVVRGLGLYLMPKP